MMSKLDIINHAVRVSYLRHVNLPADQISVGIIRVNVMFQCQTSLYYQDGAVVTKDGKPGYAQWGKSEPARQRLSQWKEIVVICSGYQSCGMALAPPNVSCFPICEHPNPDTE